MDNPSQKKKKVDEEEVFLKKRRNALLSNFFNYTAGAFLGGTIVGGAKGTIDGLRAVEKGENLKLRINRVLNSGSSVGASWGSKLGFWGMVYGGLDGSAVYLRGGSDDALNSFVAGLGTGALYKSASGVRPAAIGGVVGGITAASVATSVKFLLKKSREWNRDWPLSYL